MYRLNEYLTVAEAAVLLGVSKDTLRRWDKAGKLKARRHPVTGYRLYLKVELEELLGGLAGRSSRRKAMSKTSPRRHGAAQGRQSVRLSSRGKAR